MAGQLQSKIAIVTGASNGIGRGIAGSVSAKTPRPDSLPYMVTKFGLQGMTHQLTMDGRKHNIVSSIIHPGAMIGPH